MIIDGTEVENDDDMPLISLYKIQRYIEIETDREKLSGVSHALNIMLRQVEDKIM
jgi:hypothetical protein